MFQRIKTIKGKKYVYQEERRREGKKVISKSTYVRPWDGFSLIGHILKNGIGEQTSNTRGQIAADREMAKAEKAATQNDLDLTNLACAEIADKQKAFNQAHPAPENLPAQEKSPEAETKGVEASQPSAEAGSPSAPDASEGEGEGQ